MQRKRKIKPSAIFGVLLVALVLFFSLGGMMAGGADRPEPLASVKLDDSVDERDIQRAPAGNGLEQAAHDIQDSVLDAVDTGVEKAQGVDVEQLKNEGAAAWESLKGAFGNNFSLEHDGGQQGATPSDYSRDAFGDGWATGTNGCSVRDNILERDLTNIVKNGCVVESGVLEGRYTGDIVEHQRGSNGNASEVHIDHIVPLAYAWKHGASDWTPAQREAFANDPANLQAVSATANQAKGDSGPSDWMPSIHRCEYAQMFVSIADSYDLTIPAEDAATVQQYC